MKKLLLVAAPLLALIIFAPLAVAVVVVSILAPAAVNAIDCGANVPAAATGEWRPPFQQRYVLTSAFGRRFHPIYKEWRLHTGQDLSSLPRAGPVVAASAGIVLSADWDRDYGNIVSLRHSNRVVTRYGHLAKIDPNIVPGAGVSIGQRIGIEGSSGTSTGLHLHFQVEINGTPVNPVRFMADRGTPLDGKAIAPTGKTTSPASLGLRRDTHEGGVGFPIPRPGTPRRASLHNPPLPIPPKIKKLYLAAADRYKIPWTLLAGIGMEETGHGRNNHTSSAGAQGLMQFMPATWASMGVDGDHDRRADIHNDADSIYSAANYLTKSGVSQGAAGVRKALFAYNPINWYVNDVLFYAARYGGGTVPGDPNDCGPASGSSRKLPPLANRSRREGAGLGQRPRRRLLPHGRHRPERLGLLQLHPGRVRTDRHPNATARLGTTQLAGRRKRHPDPARAGATRRPDLLGLLPRTQPDRARHDRVEPSKQNHHRGARHPCRCRPLQLRQRASPPHLRDLARRKPRP